MASIERAETNLAHLLAQTARRYPHAPALALGDRVLADYRMFASTVARMAAAFREARLAPGDRIALVAQNTPEYIAALFACWWAGLTAVPVNAKLHSKELAYVLDDSGARWAFVDAAWQGALNAEPVPTLERIIAFEAREYRDLAAADVEAPIAPVAGDDAAWLFYTSGTTGRPKGVVITHLNLRAMSTAFLADVEAVAAGDAILHPAPLSHGSGLYVVPHVERGAVNVVPPSRGFDAHEIFELLAHWDRALFFAAPTMVKRLVRSPVIEAARLDHLKCIVFGGGPMYVEDCKTAYAAFGPRLAQIYGQGETPMTIAAMNRLRLAEALQRGDDARVASVGVAQAGIELRIGDEDDEALATGAIGEVLVRGPTVMRGYWRNPEATAATLAHGWLHTGDLGALDPDGYLTLKDRSKDVIISGGSNIYPREVEEVLLRHPDVAEVAVIGRRHADWGQEVVACVRARVTPGSDAARRSLSSALDALCLDSIARFKRPRAYIFVDELPKNNAGKILKTELRTRYLE
jgi:long-chain acyl-CoA synthetase